MKHLKHRPSLILIVLLALTLLSACGSSASAPAATPTITTAPVAGEFVGINKAAAIGISTNGQQLMVYACDGFAKQKHAPTFAVWFTGAVSHNAANLTAKNGSHLAVSWTAQAANGTVTLNSGQSFSFTAIAVPSRGGADLYRSEQTIGGVRYLAGWIIPIMEQVTLAAPASSALASVALLSGELTPFSPLMIGPEPEGGRGAVINEQTGALLAVPLLTKQAFAARREAVPNLGTFPMTYCQQGQC